MALSLAPLLGMTIGLTAFWTLPPAWLSLGRSMQAASVLLSNACTQKELLSRGDSRDILVRYQADHSSVINGELVPTDLDLRHRIEGIMATRNEQTLFFFGDPSLSFGEVFHVLSELQADDPALWLVLPPRQHTGSEKGIGGIPPICLKTSSRPADNP